MPFALTCCLQPERLRQPVASSSRSCRRAREKGTYQLDSPTSSRRELDDCVVIVSPAPRGSSASSWRPSSRWLLRPLRWSLLAWGRACCAMLDDEMWLHRLRQVSEATAIPLVAPATSTSTCARASRLQDVMTATRIGQAADRVRPGPAAERRAASAHPPAACTDLSDGPARRDPERRRALRLHSRRAAVPVPRRSGARRARRRRSYLRQITYEGAGRRWPNGMPAKVQAQIEHELELIAS